MAKKIVLFNHKGGVSKTLTTFNIAWMIASQEKRVLLVDCDPQCNLSALILGEEFDEYYTSDETKKCNVKDGLKVAFESRPEPISAVKCYQVSDNRNLYLLPGHMDLSEYEPSLSLAMNNNNSMTALQNLPGALNRLIELCAQENNIDYVFIDINPGLSAINQITFSLADRFIVPTNPDPFSLMALKTLLKVLPRWKAWADSTRPLLADASYPLPEAEMKFIGEISQRFNRRNKKPTTSYNLMINEIKEFVNGEFAEKLRRYNMICNSDQYHLAEIPDFGAMLQKSNTLGVPVYCLSDNELPGGATFENTTAKRDEIKGIFLDLSRIIMESFDD